MTKKKLRRKIARLEAELAEYRLPPPLTFLTGTVVLGETGSPTRAVDFPIIAQPGQEAPRIDLPAMGFTVTRTTPPS